MPAVRLAALLLCLFTAFPASAARRPRHLKAVDLYRSDEITLDAARKRLMPLIDRYAALRESGGRRSLAAAAKAKIRVEAGLRAMAALAYADLYYADYVTPKGRSSYITLDVVDRKDRKARMPFRPRPWRRLPDPGGLLAAWRGYAALGKRLIATGQLELTERPDGLGYYRLWGSATPKLAAYEKRFEAGALGRRKELLQVAFQDARPAQRSAALFVLSYMPGGDDVARVMQDALRDPDVDVRGAALQILADLATYDRAAAIDAGKLFPVLDYPSTADRVKALAVLVGMADNPRYKAFLLSCVPQPAVRLLRLSQPDSQDLAYTLLTMLAPAPLDRRDVDGWQRWADAQAAGAPKAGGH